MKRLLSEMRYAVRIWLRSPGLAAIAVVVLAVGIGSSIAIFTVVDHILFRPLDLPDSERLVTICETSERSSGYCSVSPPNASDWAAAARTFASLGIARSEQMALRLDDRVSSVSGGLATPGYFRALGVAPILGRWIGPEDMLPRGDGHSVVIASSLWQSLFGGAADVLGKTLHLDEGPFVIVGVLPPEFEAPRLEWVDLWTPVPFDPRDEENRDWRGFTSIGRLAPGASAAQAALELRAIDRSLARAHPDAFEGWNVDVHPLRRFLVGDSRPKLLVFLGAVIAVMLIVQVNLATILLSRSVLREKEMGVRRALGAEAGDLRRQFLMEAAVITVTGAAAGLALASWLLRIFLAVAPPGIPRLDEVAIDPRILLFALGLTAVTVLAIGLVPLFRLRSLQLSEVLRQGRSGSVHRGGARLRRALVVAELAIALIVTAGAALLIRSFSGLLEWDPGFDTRGVLTFQVYPSSGKYPGRRDVLQVYREIQRRVEAIPGVIGVGTVSAGPLFGGGDGMMRIVIPGRSDGAAPAAEYFNAGPGYFETLGIPILSGRSFTDAEDFDRPWLAVINETMAKRGWPGGDAVGATVEIPEMEGTARIIGVSRDVAPFEPERPVAPQIFVSNRQHTRWASFFVVRTAGTANPMKEIAAAIHQVDPEIEPSWTRTMEELVRERLVEPRFNMLLVGALAAVALLLGMAGIYGVMGWVVAMRRHEIGVRIALGAGSRRVVASVMRESARLVLWGSVLGIAGALLLSRFLEHMLHGVGPYDPWAIGGTALMMAIAGAVAAWRPAVRASRTDPMTTLRQE